MEYVSASVFNLPSSSDRSQDIRPDSPRLRFQPSSFSNYDIAGSDRATYLPVRPLPTSSSRPSPYSYYVDPVIDLRSDQSNEVALSLVKIPADEATRCAGTTEKDTAISDDTCTSLGVDGELYSFYHAMDSLGEVTAEKVHDPVMNISWGNDSLEERNIQAEVSTQLRADRSPADNALVQELALPPSNIVFNPYFRAQVSDTRSNSRRVLSSNRRPQRTLIPLDGTRRLSNPFSYPDPGSCDANSRKKKSVDTVDEFYGEVLSQNSAIVMERDRFDLSAECQP